ncbi:MAG: GHKL domain-containing protein [bacterium]|nr:GHKL domain-containing protein [bacterium]MCM1374358.1 GHKL domain-containing protein [Muribaculum sp.]
MTILRDLSMLWSLFHILILFMLLYRSRYPRKKTFILTGAIMGPLALLTVAGLAYYGAEFMGKIFILTLTLPSLLFFWFMSKDKNGKFFFTFCLADTVALWIIVVTNLADFYVGGQRYVLMLVGRLVLFPLAEWVAYRYLRKPYMELKESVAGEWWFFAGMMGLYYVLLTVSANFPVIVTKRPQELPTFLLILTLMPLTYATIFATMYRQLQLFRKQQSERALQEQKNTLEAQLDNQQNIRKMKHDMEGYIATLSGLLAAGKTEEMAAYLMGVEKEMDALSGQFCANPYLNAALAYYSRKLEELSADCRMDIQIGNEELPYMELCRILADGLENVCDALKGLDEKQREVSVHMKYHREYLLIRIKNRCRDDLHVERGTMALTDKKERGHGFGLPAIQEAAQRLDGDMVCYTENGYYVLDVMLPLRALTNTGKSGTTVA